MWYTFSLNSNVEHRAMSTVLRTFELCVQITFHESWMLHAMNSTMLVRYVKCNAQFL